MPEALKCVVVEPPGEADAAVIWLHGLGASGHDFEPLVPELGLPANHGVRFVFPHAPEIPVTINGGMVMPAWYDILEMDIDRRIDLAQILDSAKAVHNLIDEQIQGGIASKRIILAGFSQGGAVVCEAALSYPQPLAGLLVLSSYFATADSIVTQPANASLPVRLFHGIHDPMVPLVLGERAQALFQGMGFDSPLSTYPMEHQVCLEEIADISDCIRQWLNSN